MDFKLQEAIDKFDLIQFLEENNIEYSSEGDNIGTNWIGINPSICCGDVDFHQGINIENKSSHCWKCGTNYSLISLVANIKNVSYSKAKEFILFETQIDEELDIELKIKEILRNKLDNCQEEEKIKEISLLDCINLKISFIKNNPIIKSFFDERNLKPKHVEEYDLKIGITGILKHKLIFPIYFYKKLVAYQTRSFLESKYKITGPAHSYLYKYHELPQNSKIFLVEGILDRIRLNDFICKYFKNKYFSTTMFSKILSMKQISLLNKLNPKEIIYMLDYDAWFDYKKTSSYLNCPTSFIILPKRKDPGSMNEIEFLKLFRKNNL